MWTSSEVFLKLEELALLFIRCMLTEWVMWVYSMCVCVCLYVGVCGVRKRSITKVAGGNHTMSVCC